MSQGGVSAETTEIFARSKEALDITLLGSEWNSSAGGLSTLNRELAIYLSQQPNVRVSVLVPEGACKDEDKREAQKFGISVLDAGKQPSFSEPLDWLGFPPEDHGIDVVVGHGVKLGRQVKVMKRSSQLQNCIWVHVVHTAPEDLSKYKGYKNPTSTGEQKHWGEVALCKSADLVVPVGPKLKKAYSSYLQGCKKDEDIFEIVPGLFDREFGALVHKAKVEIDDDFTVLLCGRGDDEDFELKGYDIAVKAFADQRLKRKRYHLLFVGALDGKQDEVRRRLLNFGITNEQLTVRKFVQSREGMRDLFCEVALVIMPSKSEGFGLVALEALSAGLPILVGSNSGFARALEKVDFGETCIVDSNKPAKWAKQIEGVRAKHNKWLREMTFIRESYKEMFCWTEQCGNLVEKLWKMVHENRPTEKPELTDSKTSSVSKNFEKENRPTEKPELTDSETSSEFKNFEKENRPTQKPELTDSETSSDSENFEKENRPTEKPELTDSETSRDSENFEKENRPTEKPELTDSETSSDSENFEKDPHQGSLIRAATAIAVVVMALQVWSHLGYSNHDNMSLPLSSLPAEPLETVSYVPLGQSKTLPCAAFSEALKFEGGQLRVVHWFRWIPLPRGLCVCVPGSNCSCESGKKCTRACLQVYSQASFLLLASMDEDGHVHMKEHWWKPFSISRDDGGLYIDKVNPALAQKYMCVVQLRSKIEPFTSTVTLRLAEENGLPAEPLETVSYVPLGQSKTLPCAAFSEALKFEGGQFRVVYWFMWRREPRGLCVCASGNNCSCESGKKCRTECVDVDLETDVLLVASMDEDGLVYMTEDWWKPFSISRDDGGLYIDKVNPALAQKFMCVVKLRSTIEPLTSTVTLRLAEENGLPAEPLETVSYVPFGQSKTLPCAAFSEALKFGWGPVVYWFMWIREPHGLCVCAPGNNCSCESGKKCTTACVDVDLETDVLLVASMDEDGLVYMTEDWWKPFSISRDDGGLYIDKVNPALAQKFMCVVKLRSTIKPLTSTVTLRLAEGNGLSTEPLKTFVHVGQGQKVTVSCSSFGKALKLEGGRFSFLQWYVLESFQTQWTFLARMNEDGSRSVDGDWYKGFNITRDGGLYIHESEPFQRFRCTVELRSGRNPLTSYVTLKRDLKFC